MGSYTTPNPGFIRNAAGGCGNVDKTKVGVGTTIKRGWLIYFDAATKTSKPLNSDGNALYFQGASADQTPTQGFNIALPDIMFYRADGSNTHEVYLTPGETYYHNDLVYFGGDAITVQKGSGSNKVGIIDLDPGITSIVAVAGDKARIRLTSKYASA